MKIGSFFNSETAGKTCYSYKKRGTDEAYLPDMAREFSPRESYTAASGNLFFGREVAWSGAALLDGGIDLCIRLFERCYADHAALTFGPGTGVESIDILTK